ncbi:hypothetical protein EDB83DRAFT_2549624 [Lactarius deliciosus]|nr:hypothetical protein EDB83DRAFT_2549624 [Lactarius deliciosus]
MYRLSLYAFMTILNSRDNLRGRLDGPGGVVATFTQLKVRTGTTVPWGTQDTAEPITSKAVPKSRPQFSAPSDTSFSDSVVAFDSVREGSIPYMRTILSLARIGYTVRYFYCNVVWNIKPTIPMDWRTCTAFAPNAANPVSTPALRHRAQGRSLVGTPNPCLAPKCVTPERYRVRDRLSASSDIPKKEGAKNITFFLSLQNGRPRTAFELSELYS